MENIINQNLSFDRNCLETLDDQQYVSNDVIDFFAALLLRNYQNSKVFIMPTNIVQLIQSIPKYNTPCSVGNYSQNEQLETIQSILESFDHSNYSIILFPFTNYTSIRANNHWSLLYWQRTKVDTFYALDSFNPDITKVTRNDLISNIKTLFKLKTRGVKGKPVQKANGGCLYLDVAKQSNNFDCGIYLMAYLEDIMRNNKASRNISQFSKTYITQFRSSLQSFMRQYTPDSNLMFIPPTP